MVLRNIKLGMPALLPGDQVFGCRSDIVTKLGSLHSAHVLTRLRSCARPSRPNATAPPDAVIIEPGGSKFGLETFAEAAFGLGIDVDAFGDVCVHVKLSVVSFVWSGRWKFCCGGNGDGRDCGRLAATSERVG
jgi:hypothetical protein